MVNCELDVTHFHLYAITGDGVDYIMEMFPIVRRKDEKEFGEYRTERVILETCDAMACAMESGTAYVPRLEPEAASRSVAHEPKAMQV